MTTKFEEAFNSVVEGTKNADGTLKAKTFKRDDFETMLKGILNTPDYEAVQAKKDGEGFVNEGTPAVKKVRTSIRKVLIDYGVDKAEADSILDTYEFTAVDGFYELISEVIYKYMEAGKKFNFLTKEDFQGSLLLNNVEAGTTEHRNMQSDTNEKIKVAHKAHKVLVRKSKTPDWLKNRL